MSLSLLFGSRTRRQPVYRDLESSKEGERRDSTVDGGTSWVDEEGQGGRCRTA